MSQKRRMFSIDIKKQMVALYENGKSRQDIVREYELTASALDRWITQFRKSGSFTEKGNQSPEEEELIVLRKRNKQVCGTRKLKIELDNAQEGFTIPRRRMGRLMVQSKYAEASYEPMIGVVQRMTVNLLRKMNHIRMLLSGTSLIILLGYIALEHHNKLFAYYLSCIGILSLGLSGFVWQASAIGLGIFTN